MKTIFADTFYFIALLSPKDQWHGKAKQTKNALGKCQIVVTETVLIELLNYFSDYGEKMRGIVVETVRDLLVDLDVEFVEHAPQTFLDALDFYEARLDKHYSLTDCVSMLTMRNRDVIEVLTHDNHFAQEGFTILL